MDIHDVIALVVVASAGNEETRQQFYGVVFLVLGECLEIYILRRRNLSDVRHGDKDESTQGVGPRNGGD